MGWDAFFALSALLLASSVPMAFADGDIPTWIKSNAGWWAAGQIDDESFVSGIQFMVEEGIIGVDAGEKNVTAAEE